MRTATLLAALLFALPIAGCGGDEADEPAEEMIDDGDHDDHEHGDKAGSGDSKGDGGGEGSGDQSASGKGK